MLLDVKNNINVANLDNSKTTKTFILPLRPIFELFLTQLAVIICQRSISFKSWENIGAALEETSYNFHMDDNDNVNLGKTLGSSTLIIQKIKNFLTNQANYLVIFTTKV